MKILYIAANLREDFMADSVFHGLRSEFGEDVIDANHMWFMYKECVNRKQLLTQFHGRGFTFAGSLHELNVDRSDIKGKIHNKYYDFIVYGGIYRCDDYYDLVSEKYPAEKVIILDGDDVTTIRRDRYPHGKYFKRELYDDIHGIVPLSFSYPVEKFVNKTIEKTKPFGTIIPGEGSTYIFTDENEYYEDYRKSYFGLTWKKAGWDCLRHYEILANGCIPIFPDIKKCPKNCLWNFPKELVIESYKCILSVDMESVLNKEYSYNNRGTITNLDWSIFNDLKIDRNLYGEYLIKLYEYTSKHLTTNVVARYILQ